MTRALLPDRDAGNLQPGAEDEVIGRDVERAPVLAAPGQIGGVAWNAQPSDQLAVAVDDVDAAWSGTVDVALLVALHAVGDAGLAAGQRVEDTAVAHAAVAIDVEGADEPEACVVDVKDRLVRAEAQAVGINCVLDRELDLALWREPEHGLDVELSLQILTHHAGDHQASGGVRPVHRAVGTHDDIVRAVELLVLVARSDGDEGAVLLHPPDRARRPASDDQPAFAVEGHAVGMIRRMDQDVLADLRFPLPDGVADDVGPQEAPLAAIPHRSFAEIEPVRDGIERRIGADDPFEAGSREIDVHAFPLSTAAT